MKLKHAPDTATVMALRGRVDLYLLRGVGWVGREWPVRKAARTSGEILSSQRFQAYVKYAGASMPTVKASWEPFMAGSHGATWVDANRAVAAGAEWIVVSP